MRMNLVLLAAILAWATPSFASTNRVLDGETVTTNGLANTLTIPHITDTFVTNTFTATLTNKTLSGASNTFTNIPAATALTGVTPVANGGTGLATLTTGAIYAGNGTSPMGSLGAPSQYQVLTGITTNNPGWGAVNLAQSAAVTGILTVPNGGSGIATATLNGMLFGNGSSAMGITAAGTQYQVFQAGASGVPTVDAVHLDQSAAVTGILPVSNGGSGANTLSANAVLLGNGTSALQTVAPGTSGNVLTSNGTTWSSTAPASGTPNVTGTRASPTNVTAAGGVTFSGSNYVNIAFVQGNAGAVTITASPQIAAGSSVGQLLRLVGRSATNTITMADGTGLSLNGGIVLGLDSVLSLIWDGTNWLEVARR